MILYRGDIYENRSKIGQDEFYESNFNRGGIAKNDAQFYFFADTEDLAKHYSPEVISIWEFTGSILDVRSIMDRAKIAHLYKDYYENEIQGRIENLKYIKLIKDRKKAESDIERLKELGYNHFIVNDSESLFWAQGFSDFQNGVKLRKWLIENGYKGFITTESVLGNTIGLINLPHLLKITSMTPQEYQAHRKKIMLYK